MREIKHIVLHCTATPTNTRVASILRYWKEVLGWKNPGYHFIVKRNGHIQLLLPLDQVANGVKGHNAHAIHVSYVGGIDAQGKAEDNRTFRQRESMVALVRSLQSNFPKARVLGHRDFPNVAKDCPSFDVAQWLKEVAHELV